MRMGASPLKGHTDDPMVLLHHVVRWGQGSHRMSVTSPSLPCCNVQERVWALGSLACTINSESKALTTASLSGLTGTENLSRSM
jgi:predicted hotdog family 3-hydroxylacyl-ACP dehydratase